MENNKSSYSFKYGDGQISFALDSALDIRELKIKEYPALTDPASAIREAIRNPLDTKPLREIVKPGQSVVFIVNDPTRVANSDAFMPILLDELNSVGIPDEKMFIVFALGTHRLMTKEEMAKTVGEQVTRRVRMYNSDCRDESQFKYLGNTRRGTPVWIHKLVAEADHIVATGSVVHHFFSGFGGGRKAVLPGVAKYETIRKNHEGMFDPNAVLGKLEGNPVYEDQIEAVEMCRPSFLLNVVLNEKKQFLKIFAGDYITAHKAACRFVDEIYGTEIKEKADLVIAGAGGYPKDINVYQLQKTMDNAWCAVRDGGVVILIGECREGSGSALYEETMRQYRTPGKIEEALRANFQVGAHKAYAVTRLMKRVEFILVSGLDPELARLLLFTPAPNMEEALRLAYEKTGSRPKVILMPQGSLTIPRTT